MDGGEASPDNSEIATQEYPMRLLALVFALAATASAHAAPIDPAKAFAAIYMQTCVQYANNPEALAEMLDDSGAQRFPDDRLKPFLPDGKGIVWDVGTAAGPFAIAIRTNRNCSVYAKTMDPDAVAKELGTITNALAKNGYLVQKGFDEVSNTPLATGVRVISYTAGRTAEARRLQLTLTTTKTPQSGIQAMLSVAVVAK